MVSCLSEVKRHTAQLCHFPAHAIEDLKIKQKEKIFLLFNPGVFYLSSDMSRSFPARQ